MTRNENGTVDLSPTRKAAERLAELLPDEKDTGVPSGESWHFFHFQTNDFCAVERTVRLACQKKKLRRPCFLPIEEFSGFLQDPEGKSPKMAARRCGYDFTNITLRGEYEDNCQFVVWQAYNRMRSESIIELEYGQLLSEFLHFCEDERAARLFGEKEHEVCKQIVFAFYGPECPMPALLRDSMCVIRYDSLGPEDFRVLLREYWCRNRDRELRENPFPPPYLKTMEPPVYKDTDLNWYATRMSGIPELGVRRLLDEMRHGFSSAGNVDFARTDIIEPRIVAYKNETLKIHDRLEVVSNKRGKADGAGKNQVKGLDTVTKWLENQDKVMRAGGPAPTGILLVGIPGSGKSATAKLAAQKLDLPLVKLDMSKILGGYVGDSEKGMREMLTDLAYAAPCVLWIDEVEKAMSGASGKSEGSGVIQRLFGMLLEFMQENDKPVFTVTTANDISKLPPEFFRNGRFDQAFCVMMPEYKGCVNIMEAKLTGYMKEYGGKLGWNPESDAMRQYAGPAFDACVGTRDNPRFLTGADIEAHVKELFCVYTSNPPETFPTPKELAATMKEVTYRVRAQAPASSLTAMRDIAARYLDMLQRGLRFAGSEKTPFTKENLDMDRVRYFVYQKENESKPCELKDCVVHPNQEAFKAALKGKDPKDWYDARFFEIVVGYMNELIIYDRELTPDETRREYFRMKTDRKPSSL